MKISEEMSFGRFREVEARRFESMIAGLKNGWTNAFLGEISETISTLDKISGGDRNDSLYEFLSGESSSQPTSFSKLEEANKKILAEIGELEEYGLSRSDWVGFIRGLCSSAADELDSATYWLKEGLPDEGPDIEMGSGKAKDAWDVAEIADLMHSGRFYSACRSARKLDTIVREGLPDDFWTWLLESGLTKLEALEMKLDLEGKLEAGSASKKKNKI